MESGPSPADLNGIGHPVWLDDPSKLLNSKTIFMNNYAVNKPYFKPGFTGSVLAFPIPYQH